MGFKCSVRNCKSGYNSQIHTGKPVSFYRFPFDQSMRLQWLHAINRDAEFFTENWRICAFHFNETDFITVSQDTRKVRIGGRESEHLKVKRLRPCAIPSIFKDQSTCLQEIRPSQPLTTCRPRSTSRATSERRLYRENERIVFLEKEFHEKEKIIDLNDILVKLKSEKLPNDYVIVSRDHFILFLYIDVSSKNPSVWASVRINTDLTAEVTVKNTSIPTTKFCHLLQDRKKVTTISEVLNLLAEVKSLVSVEPSSPDSIVEVLIEIISKLFLLPDVEHRDFFASLRNNWN